MSPGTTLSPLGYKLFAIVWLSFMASHLAASIQGVGAQWQMTATDGRADMVGLIHTATTLPIMLLAMVGGAIADLYDRRKVMIGAQLGIALGSILLAYLTWTGMATPWVLIGVTFALGTFFAFYQPAVIASIPVLLPRSEISGAIGLNVTGFNVARAVGPAIGGFIVGAGGAVAAFIVSAVFSIVSAIIVMTWRPPPFARIGGGLRGMLPAIAEGVRTVRQTPQLRAIVLRGFCFTFCGTAVWGLMPLVARDLVGGGPERFGMLLGALGAGGLVGSAASHEFRRRFYPEGLARTAGIIFGVVAIITALRPGLYVTLAILVVGGAFWVQAVSGFSVSSQIWSPRALVGRITSITTVAVWGGLAVGAWFWGYLAQVFGTAWSIGGSGVALFAVVALGLVMPLPRNDLAPEQEPPASGK